MFFLEVDIKVRKSDSTNFYYDDPLQLLKNAFAICFKEARLSTTLGSDIEIHKFFGQVSTIMRVISDKDGDFFSKFDNFNENDIPVLERLADLLPQFQSTPHQKMLINNHLDANKGKIKRYLFLEDIFGFCKFFKKVTKNLGFHPMLKTADSQYNIYKPMTDDDINVNNNSLYLFIPKLIPSVETQLLFNEATQNNYKKSYDDYFTEIQVKSDLLV